MVLVARLGFSRACRFFVQLWLPKVEESRLLSSQSQSVDAALTRAAIFLVLTVNDGSKAEEAVRSLCAELSSLVRAIGFRSQEDGLSCITGIGAAVWERLFDLPLPKNLHSFREIHGVHLAPATPGDLLFHIRANRMDLCFELATIISQRLEGLAEVVDEVHGFKYFDARDLLGFVDGTENPVAQAAINATIIQDEDIAYAGGSYVIIQKYLHDLTKWNAIPVEQQEAIIGRKKLSDIELPEAAKTPYAHNVLTNITENGEQVQILRDNMPFGAVGRGEFGTYFIGYAKSPSPIEQMLNNMFVGKPAGNYDRLLDVSTAVTGCLFFVPSAVFLDNANSIGATDIAVTLHSSGQSVEPKRETFPSSSGGSLRIGSLKDGDKA